MLEPWSGHRQTPAWPGPIVPDLAYSSQLIGAFALPPASQTRKLLWEGSREGGVITCPPLDVWEDMPGFAENMTTIRSMR